MTETVTWASATAGISLAPNNVHIWRASLDVDSEVLERLASFLSLEERERAARFVFERDRNRFAVSRGILRQLLGGYLDEPPQAVHIERLAYGKPTLTAAARKPLLRFNLSHSHEIGLFAFCSESEVGIDVEKIRPEIEFEKIAKRFFSPTELAEFETLAPELRPEGFFLCWTRKEAYLKANGEGLHTPLDSFDVSLTPELPSVLRAVDQDRWLLHSLRPDTGFVGALVVEGRAHRLNFCEWREPVS